MKRRAQAAAQWAEYFRPAVKALVPLLSPLEAWGNSTMKITCTMGGQAIQFPVFVVFWCDSIG